MATQTWSDIESSAAYQGLPPAEQGKFKRNYLGQVVGKLPAYQALPDDQKKAFLGNFLGLDTSTGAQRETNPIASFVRGNLDATANDTPMGNVERAVAKATGGQTPAQHMGKQLGGEFYTADPLNNAANYLGREAAMFTDPTSLLPMGAAGGEAVTAAAPGVLGALRAALPTAAKGAAINAGIGGTASAAGQYADTGKVDPGQLLADTASAGAVGGLMAGAHPFAGAYHPVPADPGLTPRVNLLPTDPAMGPAYVPQNVRDFVTRRGVADEQTRQMYQQMAEVEAAHQQALQEQAQRQALTDRADADRARQFTLDDSLMQHGGQMTPEAIAAYNAQVAAPGSAPRPIGDVRLPDAPPVADEAAIAARPDAAQIPPPTAAPAPDRMHAESPAQPDPLAPREATVPAARPIPDEPAIGRDPMTPPDAATPRTSPAVDAARLHMNFERLDLDPSEKERMASLVNDYVAENGDAHKTPVTFDQIRKEAAAIAPAAVDQLAPPRKGETMDPAVRYAARIRLNETMDAIRDHEVQLQNGSLSPEQSRALRQEHGALTDRAKKLLDVLIPTRSQDGRNLAFHNLMAGKSFDSEYWTARARRVGGRTDPAFEKRMNDILGNGRAAESQMQAAEAALRERGIDPATASDVQPGAGPSGKPDPGRVSRVADAIEQHGQQTIEQARKNQNLGTAGGAGGGLLLGHSQVLAAKMLRGAVRFADWARGMVADHGQAIADHLPGIWSRAREIASRLMSEEHGALRNPFESWRNFGRPGVGPRGITHPDPAIQGLLDQHHQAQQRINATRIALARHFATLDRHGLLQTISMLRKAGLLTSVRTLTKITASHVTLQGLEEAMRLPAWGVDLAASAVFGGERTVLAPSAARVLSATHDAFTRGLVESWEILRHGMTDEELAKLNIPGELNSAIPVIGPVLSAYVNGVMRVHGAAYHPFKVYAATKAMQEQARLTAMSQMGLRVGGGPMLDAATKAGLDQRVSHLLAHPTPQMEAEATAAAEFATFTEENRLAQGISSLKNRQGPLGRFLIDQVLPFTHVPANVCVRVLDYAMVGGVARMGAAAQRRMTGQVVGSLTPAEQKMIATALGRGMVGTGLILYGYLLAQKGNATGTYDPKYRDLYQAAGRGFSSIKVGNEWRPIGDLSPVGNLIALGATLQRDKGTPASIASVGASTVLDQPMMQGVTQLESLHKDAAKGATKFAADNLASYVPTMVSDFANSGDPKAREVSHEGWDALGDAVKAKLPGQREKLPVRIGVFGDEVPNVRGGMGAFSTFAGPTDKAATNPAAAELIRLEAARQPGDEPMPLTQPGKSYSLAGQRFELPPDLVHDRKVSTGRSVADVLNDFATDKGYLASSDDDKRTMIRKALGLAHEQGSAQFKADHVDALFALLQKAQGQKSAGR